MAPLPKTVLVFLQSLLYSFIACTEFSKTVIRTSGQDVILNCTVESQDTFLSRANNNEIIWKFEANSSLTRKKLDQKLIESTWQTEDKSETFIASSLYLRNISKSNTGNYACYLENHLKSVEISSVQLTVTDSLTKPTLNKSSCVTTKLRNQYRYEMKCCWEGGTSESTSINYTLIAEKDGSKFNYQKCFPCCTIDFKQKYIVFMTLVASNGPERIESEMYAVDPSNYILPPPPTDLKLQSRSGNRKNSILVTWNEPDIPGINYLYNIKYSIEDENPMRNWKNAFETKGNFELKNVAPETYYVFKVAAKPNDEIEGVVGYWSNWTEEKWILSGAPAPQETFSFIKRVKLAYIGSYSFIQVIWVPYIRQQENGFYNKISHGCCEQSNPWTTIEVQDKNKYAFNASGCDDKVCVNGSYCNAGGCSTFSTLKLDLNEAKPPISAIRLTYLDNSTMSIKWNPPKGKNSTCSIQICGIPRIKTIPSNENTCGFASNVVHEVSYIKCYPGFATVVGKWNPCLSYSASVSITNGSWTVSSSASEIKQYDPRLPTISEFTSSDSSSSTQFRIYAKWSRFSSCNDLRLNIFYQAIPGAECSPSPTYGESFRKTVNCSDESTILSKDVFGCTRYLVTMGLTCPQEPDSKTFYFPNVQDYVTTKSGKPEAPSHPRLKNRQAERSVLEWRPPSHPNGKVFYEITQKHYNRRKNSTIDVKVIESLMPRLNIQTACPPKNNSTFYSFDIKSVVKNNGMWKSEPVSLGDVQCTVVTEDGSHTMTIAVAAFAAIFFVCMVLLSILLCCHRRIRQFIKIHFWPDVPMPSLTGSDPHSGMYQPLHSFIENDSDDTGEMADKIIFPEDTNLKVLKNIKSRKQSASTELLLNQEHSNSLTEREAHHSVHSVCETPNKYTWNRSSNSQSKGKKSLVKGLIGEEYSYSEITRSYSFSSRTSFVKEYINFSHDLRQYDLDYWKLRGENHPQLKHCLSNSEADYREKITNQKKLRRCWSTGDASVCLKRVSMKNCENEDTQNKTDDFSHDEPYVDEDNMPSPSSGTGIQFPMENNQGLLHVQSQSSKVLNTQSSSGFPANWETAYSSSPYVCEDIFKLESDNLLNIRETSFVDDDCPENTNSVDSGNYSSSGQ